MNNLNKLLPYPKYKDSGVEWLGKVPGGWKVQNLRNILKPNTKKNRPELPLLSVVREKGIIKRDITSKDENHNVIPEDLSNYKVVEIGQFVMNKMKAWQGSYGISEFNGIVSPAYFIFDLKGIEPKFFHNAIRSKKYIPFFAQASDGVRIGQWDLSLTRMKEISIVIPTFDEQSKIVHYLNYMNSRIARYISAKKKLIKLLEEQKEAIIHHAVTGAIDVRTGKPYPKYKKTGVEWLGKVPEDWEIKPLKFIFKLINNCLDNNTPSNYTFSYVDISTVGVGKLKQTPVNMSFNNAPSRARKIVQKGDTIVSTVRTYLKSVYYFSEEIVDTVASTGFAVLRAKQGITSEFIPLITQADLFTEQVVRNSVGTAYPAINEAKLGRILIPVPNLNDQICIVEFIKSQSSHIDRTLDHIKREIELLTEYRTSLTADVVTGKVDVRGIADNLPDDFNSVIDESDENDSNEVINEDFELNSSEESI